jgi:hypothetical protein
VSWVLIPGYNSKEMAIKLAGYVRARVRLVWHINPGRKRVTVHPRARERGKKVVGLGGVLDGGDVLPGFTLPVVKVFEKARPGPEIRPEKPEVTRPGALRRGPPSVAARAARAVRHNSTDQYLRITPTSTPRMVTFSLLGSTTIVSMWLLHGSSRTWSRFL